MDDDKELALAAAELYQQTIDLLNRIEAYRIEAARLRQEAATARRRVGVGKCSGWYFLVEKCTYTALTR